MFRVPWGSCRDRMDHHLGFVPRVSVTGTRGRSGSTTSQTAELRKARTAATRKEVVHPKCAAMNGVSDAVTAPPSCAPIFMNPDTEPEKGPPMSALMAQKELCERYNAPAPPARMTLANGALSTMDPHARKMPVRPSPTAATPHLPALRPTRLVRKSATRPPSAQPTAIARKGSVA